MTSSPRVFALAMLNSSLDEFEIAPFLDGLLAAGYEGICLHPRDGLRVPYDSRVYWQKIDRILEMCRERDFAIWHYDEFPFPSGMAGGLLPADDPSSVVRGLKFEEIELVNNRDGAIEIGSEPLLALLRYRVDLKGEKCDVRDATADCGAYLDTWVWGEWHNRFYTGALNVHEELHERASADRFTRAFVSDEPLQDDEKLLAVKSVVSPGRVGLPGRPDVTRPEITDRFLNRIYSRLSQLSAKHGLKNTPVFQDEVTFGAAWPWNEEIARRLRETWGENFHAKLAALHAPDISGWELARLEYRCACHDAFEQNWFVRVRDFCHVNNLQMTGHLAGEESLVGHWQLMGDAFKNLRHFDIPGYDIISSTISDELNRSQQIGIKIVQSAAWLEERKPTMVEVFGAHGFHSDLQKQRNVLAWLGAHDFAQVFDHSAYQSAHSIRKYDAPPVSTRFNPLALGRPDLWNWHHWFSNLMSEFSFHPRTLILFPIESLARYCLDESDLWREEISFLETWFHYAFAASLDAIFLPAHFLNQVEARADGFHLQGHVFEDFVVPPLASLHEETWSGVLQMKDHAGFSMCCNAQKTVGVFGANISEQIDLESVFGARLWACDETELLEKKAAFFDDIFKSPQRDFTSDETLLKTRRKNKSGEDVLVLINTHGHALDVRCSNFSGEAISQPPTNCAGMKISDGEIHMMPREVLVLRQSAPGGLQSAAEAREEIHPTQAHFKFASPNFLKLESGVLQIEGHAQKPFAPAPVSGIWKIEDVEYADTGAVYAPAYSRAALPRALKLEAEFSIALAAPLEELCVLMDGDSLPAQTKVTWNGHILQSQRAEILDQSNSVFPIPVNLLKTGAHVLKFESVVSRASEGILERPILSGKFLVGDDFSLRAIPSEKQNWNGESWARLGMPHAFGPHEYEFIFELDDAQAAWNWQLQLSSCIGVAEVWIEDEAIGRASWEPRVLQARELKVGENCVRVRLSGSWNNLFSNLNNLKNGLSDAPILRCVE